MGFGYRIIRNVLPAVALAFGALHAAPSLALHLITDEEAARPNEMLTRGGLTRSPGLKVVSPTPDATVSGGFPLRIEFTGRGGAKVNPKSLRLVYLKQPQVDLAPRIAAHVTDGGVSVDDVRVPPGTHMLRIEVADQDGRVTSETMRIVAR